MLTQPERDFARLVAVAVAVCALQFVGGAAAIAATPQLGEPTLMLNAKSSFDPYVTEAAPQTQEFAQQRYWRMRAPIPRSFDRALNWAAPTQFYEDLYAIYNPRQTGLVDEHPDWVLRDAAGEPLYIQYGCTGGSCPQYAADIGNPDWRRHWIEEAAGELAKGYVGIFVDDVNMEMRVSDGSGAFARPIDPRTGAPMTDADWRRYIAEFAEAIRASIADHRDHPQRAVVGRSVRPYVQREIKPPIRSSSSAASRLRAHPGRRHIRVRDLHQARRVAARAGKDGDLRAAQDARQRARAEFELAGYFLLQRGSDALAVDEDGEAYPDRWWHGWNADLGRPRGGIRIRHGVLQRKFSRGLVLLNQPDSASRRIELSRRYVRCSGRRVRSVRLGASRGRVLIRAGRR